MFEAFVPFSPKRPRCGLVRHVKDVRNRGNLLPFVRQETFSEVITEIFNRGGDNMREKIVIALIEAAACIIVALISRK